MWIMSGQGGRAEGARLQSSQMEEPLEGQYGQRGSVNTHRVPEEGSPSEASVGPQALSDFGPGILPTLREATGQGLLPHLTEHQAGGRKQPEAWALEEGLLLFNLREASVLPAGS